jgi:hypothetical protein
MRGKVECAMARIPSEVTDRLSDILRQADDPPLYRRSGVTQSDGPSQLSSIIQGVSGASVAEIDGLIDELRSFRDYLLKEGQRIQRELTEYARLSQGAIETTRVITETVLKVKTDRSPPIQ